MWIHPDVQKSKIVFLMLADNEAREVISPGVLFSPVG